MPNLQRGGGMPHICFLFHAILQSWRPKGGRYGTMPPPKYTPGYDIRSGLRVEHYFELVAFPLH